MAETFQEFSKRTRAPALARIKALCIMNGVDIADADEASTDAAVEALWAMEMVKDLHARVVALEAAAQHPPVDGQDPSRG